MSNPDQMIAYTSGKVDLLRPGLISLQATVSDIQDEPSSSIPKQLSTELQSLNEQLCTVLLQLQVVTTGSSTLESCSSEDIGSQAVEVTPSLSLTSSAQLPETPRTACSTPLAVNISSLLDLLASHDPAVQAGAAGSLRSCSLSRQHCCDIVGNGGLLPLMKLFITSSSLYVKESVIGTLCNLATFEPSSHAAIADAGGIKAAVQLLGGCHSSEAHYQAAVLLHTLACSNPSHIADTAAAGAIPPLLQLLSSSSSIPAVQAAVVSVLSKLASQPSSCAVMAAFGGCQPLVAVLDNSSSSSSMLGSSTGSSDFVEELVATISNLAKHPLSQADIIAAGGIPLLVQMLGSGAFSVRVKAAEALNPLAASADAHALIAEADGVASLLKMMNPECAGGEASQAAAAAALAQLAVRPSGRGAIAAAGSIPCLVQLLSESGSPAVQEAVVQVLQNLAVDPNLCGSITAAGSVQPLVRLLSVSRASNNSSMQAATAGCLGNLAWDRMGCSAIAAAGGIQVLVELLGCEEESALAASAAAVAKLAWEPELCSDIADAGGITALVSLLSSSSNEDVLQPAAAALQNLTYECPTLRKAVCSAGAIPPLVNLLEQVSNEAVQKHAAATLHNLALDASNCQVIAAAGGVEHLSRLMDSDNDALQAAAGGAIGKLALEPAVRLVVAECRRQPWKA